MKKFKYIIGLFLTIVLFSNCEESSFEFGDIVALSNVQITAEIVGQDADNPYGDGSGIVQFTATGNNAITYKFIYNEEETIAQSGVQSYNFAVTGINTYTVTVLAIGTGGVSSSSTIEVEVLALYEAPDDLLEMLVGDGTKTWRIKAEAAGHFGLGPVGGSIATEWYGAGANEKVGVGMYDDQYIFNDDGTFTHLTNGTVFGRETLIEEIGGPGDGEADGADIKNYSYADYTESWSLSAPNEKETISLTGTAFIGYYVGGNHKYEIFSRSATEMVLRTTDGNGDFDWWFILTTEAEVSDEFVSQYNDLIWSDEFDTDGAPDSAKWGYDLGAGGWGNGEVQTYTNDAENVIVDGGFLKINAIKNDNDYSSARLKSQGLFGFTYGRVEVRAKLPASAGTWPAIWMLGDSFSTVGWPQCGEIDIMEQTGANKNTTLGTFHWFDSGTNAQASYGESTTVGTSTTDFHNYSLEWTSDKVTVLVDNVPFVSMDNNSDLPFDEDFFLILNIAMGGTLGGDIDASFTEDTMEIDYVRVYQ